MTQQIATVEHDLPDSAEEAPEARLLEHAYDGIREYDNPLPGWWSWIFAGTVAFAAMYGFYFHVVHRGATPEQTYKVALAEYDEKKEARAAAEAANVSEQTIANASHDPQQVERGAALFQQRCVSCHGDKAQGLIGPNLTDLRQIHGDSRMHIYQTIEKGVPGTAMLAWGEQLPQTDVLALATFVTTLRGANVAGKEPQGAPVEKFQ